MGLNKLPKFCTAEAHYTALGIGKWRYLGLANRWRDNCCRDLKELLTQLISLGIGVRGGARAVPLRVTEDSRHGILHYYHLEDPDSGD